MADLTKLNVKEVEDSLILTEADQNDTVSTSALQVEKDAVPGEALGCLLC